MISINSILIIGSVIFAIDYHILGTATVERAVGLYSNPNRAGYTSCIAQAFAFYLIIDKNQLTQDYNPSNFDIKEYYNINKEQFSQNEKRSFIQYNFKTTNEANSFQKKIRVFVWPK